MNAALENEVLADMANLEKTLTEDVSGDHARAMLSYFDEVAKASEDVLRSPPNDAERHLAQQLLEGFHAAQRIVRHVWEALHSTSLPA